MTYPKILKLDSTGQPIEWIDWQKAVQHQYTGDVSWSMGEISFTFRGGHNKNGEQSVVTVASILAVKGHARGKTGKSVPALSNASLFRRDRYVCAYCGKKFPEEKLSREHIIPTSRGGKNTWMNVVTACKADNHMKADKTPEEAGMKLLYVPYVPSRAEELILKGRNILADQMEFLLSFVPDESPLKKSLIQ
jgi:5-methylcytosine-specific restriction endonuclease McrA